MTRRIDKVFKDARREGRKALIPYIMAGDPNLDTTIKLVKALDQAGADAIELGIPFSDPIADGPVILRAAMRALTHDTTLTQVLDTVRELRKHTQIPIIFMTYYNPIYVYGDAAFAKDAVAAGVDGVIIPDLPPEESADLVAASRKHDLSTVFLLAPTSNEARIKKVCRLASGFVYYVSLTGITGSKLTDFGDVAERIGAIRQHTKKPICVGFGISNAEQARAAGKAADGVIVGSALVRVIEEHIDADAPQETLVAAATKFLTDLRTGLDA
jgi:tryptophan synthase alpha chain